MSLPSLKKTALFFSAAGFVLFVFSFTVDLWAQKRLPFIESALSEALDRPVEIQKAGYTLWGGFTLDRLKIKEIKTVPAPFEIQRVRAKTSFELYPRPKIRVSKLIFEKPFLGLIGQPEELFRAGSLVRKIPVYRTMVGRVVLEMKLSSFEVKKGRVVVFSDIRGDLTRQEFEQIDFFAGKSGFNKNHMRVSGRIAGRPEARFRIESDLLREAPGSFDTNVQIDLHEFTGSYLAPYLQDRFKLPEKNLTASLRLKIRDGKRLESDGRFDLQSIGFDDRILRYLTRRPPVFRYSLTGLWTKHGIEFDNILVQGRALRMAGTGRVDLSEGSESFRFALASESMPLEKFKDLPNGWELQGGTAVISAALTGSAKRFDPVIEIVLNNAAAESRMQGLRFRNTKGLLRLTPKSTQIEELWTFINDFPLCISGKVRNDPGRRSASLVLSTFPGQIQYLKSQNPINGSLRLRAEEKKGEWNGCAKLDLEDYAPGHPSKRILVAAFKGLSLDRHRSGWFVLRSIEKDGRKLFRPLTTRAVRFALRYNQERVRLDIVDAKLGDGHARGAFYLDLNEGRWKTRFDLENIGFRSISKMLFLEYPVDGRLFLRGHAVGSAKEPPSAGLQVELVDGFIGPSLSQKEWARQTGIEALSRVRFDRLGGTASLKKGVWEVTNLELSSPDGEFTADFQIDGGLVNGRLAVRFPIASIKKGSALSWLLGFVGQRDWVDFDFHLAGDIRSPRIEWLAGEFRQKLERRIPSFLRGALAKQIEQRLSMGNA